MYAIIETCGKQYRVSPGQSIEVSGLAVNVGEMVDIDDVLLVADDGKVEVGKPTVPGARVRAKVVGRRRGRRITVFKFRGGNRYRRKRGHRQDRTTLLIADILRGGAEEGRQAPSEAAEELLAKEEAAVSTNVPIEGLGLPARVEGALTGAGLKTVADLLQKDEKELLAVRGFGAKSLEQVRAVLREKGFIK
ncbi:MAG TPA: 50S ribosomal protein L21 [Anaerolineae bacterium]|nr:50S ribosomal protein L21 [Anaerolineae bacterium]